MNERVSKLRHFGGFVLAGLTAFVVDIAVLALLTRTLGLSPYVARFFAISTAMVVSWWINRTMTFAIAEPPSLKEFAKFAVVAWAVQWFNLALYAGIVFTQPQLAPEVAAGLGTSVAMFVSYFGYKFGVFRKA